MKEYIIPILEFLYPKDIIEPRKKDFKTILEGAGEIKLNVIDESKLRHYLEVLKLITIYVDRSCETVRKTDKYTITDYGKEVITHLRYLQQLDKLLNWLKDDFLKNGNKASSYSVAELCKMTSIEYSIHYDADLLETSLLVNRPTKEGNSFHLKPMSYKARLQYFSNDFFVIKYLNDLVKPYHPQKEVPAVEYISVSQPVAYPQNITHQTWNIGKNEGDIFANAGTAIKTAEKTEAKKRTWFEKTKDILSLPGLIATAVSSVFFLILLAIYLYSRF